VTWDTTAVANGGHSIQARATDSQNASVTTGAITVNVNNEVAPDFVLPTTIQAEDYNDYSDTTAGNTGGRYRFDDVDIEICTDPTTPAGTTCYNVGWTAAGEWLAYDVRVPSAGNYTFALRVATPSNNRTLQLQLNGSNLGAAVAIPNTGGYQAWSTVTVVRSLPAGDHELRVVFGGTNLNLNSLTVTAATANSAPTATITAPINGATVSGTTTIAVVANDAQDAAGSLDVQVRIDNGTWQTASWHAGSSRYLLLNWNTAALSNGSHTIQARAIDSAGATGTATSITVTVNNSSGAVTLPATLQAEDYVDYQDSDAGNVGGAYRNDDVDIAVWADGNPCHYVGWTMAGEWLDYNVSTTTSRIYTVRLRYASPYASRWVRIEVDGTPYSIVSLPASGGWETWQTAVIGTPTLSAGQHTIRLRFEKDGTNVNWLLITQ
jgi:hypothetical protein